MEKAFEMYIDTRITYTVNEGDFDSSEEYEKYFNDIVESVDCKKAEFIDFVRYFSPEIIENIVDLVDNNHAPIIVKLSVKKTGKTIEDVE